MAKSNQTPASSSNLTGRAALLGTWRAVGGPRTLALSLLTFALGTGAALAAFFVLDARARERQRVAFAAEATSVVGNLRSGFELPLEVLGSTAALFEASREVSRAEFARFVAPALERHRGVRALEWIPIVPGEQRQRFEAAARADGLVGFEFRQKGGAGMVSASARSEYLPIYFMEPGHPLVLGFDCASDQERRSTAERARAKGHPVASERLRMLDDPESVYSIAVFQPVFDPDRPRSPGGVRGFTCEVFRVRAVAERAIDESLRRGIEVTLLDPDAAPDKRLLFESSPSLARPSADALSFATTLQFADRRWRIVLSAGPGYRSELKGTAWISLLAGMGLSALLALALGAATTIGRLRRQVRAAQQLGQYTLLEELGRGGVGVVYKARHAMLRRPTAVKLLSEHVQDPNRLARFEREVQLTSELTHPNTIAIYDYGRTPAGVFYYAMEFIDGITLEQLVQKVGPLPAARVLHLLRQACNAIAEAHAVGLVHRDIKPANLMICRRGGIADFIKVMDFGLVKDLGTGAGRTGSSNITQSASVTVLGTPLYLAPEAISQPEVLDGRADLYALGAVAYYLLVGEPVFTGETIVEVCSHHLHAIPVPPSERTRNPIPASLERIVLRCLEKRPADRFDSMAALLAALEKVNEIDAWRAEDGEAWWRIHGETILLSLRGEQKASFGEEPTVPVA